MDAVMRVMVVSDVRFYRESLSEAIERRSWATVLGADLRWPQAIDRILELKPDLLLLDSATPGGRDVVGRLASAASPIKVVVIALTESPDRVLDWAECGIAGYVPRGSSLEHLFDVLEATARGELHCSPEVAASMLRRVGRSSSPHRQAPRWKAARRLTAREREILDLISQGCSNKAIARELGITVATAKNHVHNILQKLDVQRRGQAVAALRGTRGGTSVEPTDPGLESEADADMDLDPLAHGR